MSYETCPSECAATNHPGKEHGAAAISDEAVEVLASRDWAKDAERSEHEFPSWEEAARDNEWAGLVKEYRADARAALEAAAPHMLAPVIKLADVWEALGERDIADSKTFEDEDIAMAFLTEGANKVEAARHLRNALNPNPYRS